MQFKNTIQTLQQLGSTVVKQGKSNLKKEKKQTRQNTLYNDFNYLVTSQKNKVKLEFVFGGAEDYWEFVDEGVKGSGGYKPGKKFKSKRGGTGLMRGQGSPFSFKKKNIKKGVVLKWIANKPLRLRNEKGQFMQKSQSNLESAAFVIGRAIAQRGLTRTLFFTKPYNREFKKFEDKIVESMADDLELELEKILKD